MPWTIEHALTLIPATVIFIIFAIWLGNKLRYKSEKIRLIPIHIISGLLVILEIIKQVKSVSNGYDLYHLPLHFCGMFVFLFPAFSLCRGKSEYVARLLTTISGLMMIGVMTIMPNVVYGDDDIINFFTSFWAFHTVIFHNIVLLGILLIFTLNLFKPRYQNDYKIVFISYTIYCLVVAPISLTLEINYNNFHSCAVPLIENWRLAWIDTMGYFGQILYTGCAIILTISFGLFIYYIYTKLIKLYKIIYNRKYHYDVIG